MRVYVGGLSGSVDRSEVQREFQRFGTLADVWVARNPPGFAFLEFEDDHDAQDACKEMDGRELFGGRLRVEVSRGGRGGGRGGRGSYGRGGSSRRSRSRSRSRFAMLPFISSRLVSSFVSSRLVSSFIFDPSPSSALLP
eukprot:m.171136 g.171136  ORF g.171136 m.171136 type:complete len:139 (+) comp53261_c0_seq48:148-564(+)